MALSALSHHHSGFMIRPTSRFESWRRCHDFFGWAPEQDLDEASARLIEHLDDGRHVALATPPTRDKAVVRPAIETILKSRFADLHDLEFADSVAAIGLIMELSGSIELPCRGRTFSSGRSAVISKALLATLGCVPSFDRTSVAGMRACGIEVPRLDPGGLAEVFRWARRNEEEIAAAREALSMAGAYYPDMKLIDAHFWHVGRVVLRQRLPATVRWPKEVAAWSTDVWT